MRKDKLTPEIEKKILDEIEAGGWPHVAAEAAGVSREQFSRWLLAGEKPKAHKAVRNFARQVKIARAKARLKAEKAVLLDDPKTWLRSGPGKERPNDPGWTSIVKPILTNQTTQTINLLASPDFLAFLANLRQVLAGYPEALEAVSDALDGKPSKTLPPRHRAAALPLAPRAAEPREASLQSEVSPPGPS
jgi:hypothetical protein